VLSRSVVGVEAPLLFWVQLRNTEKIFEKLQSKLQVKMTTNKKLLINIHEDQVVSVMHNKLWHRGIVTRESAE